MFGYGLYVLAIFLELGLIVALLALRHQKRMHEGYRMALTIVRDRSEDKRTVVYAETVLRTLPTFRWWQLF